MKDRVNVLVRNNYRGEVRGEVGYRRLVSRRHLRETRMMGQTDRDWMEKTGARVGRRTDFDFFFPLLFFFSPFAIFSSQAVVAAPREWKGCI